MNFDFNEIIDVNTETRIVLLRLEDYSHVAPGKWPQDRMVSFESKNFSVFLRDYKRWIRSDDNSEFRVEAFEMSGDDGFFSYTKYRRLTEAAKKISSQDNAKLARVIEITKMSKAKLSLEILKEYKRLDDYLMENNLFVTDYVEV